MINDDATFRWKGYRSTELSKGSSKKVWAVCDICGKGRWIHFFNNNSICKKCVRKGKKHNAETKKLMSNAKKGGISWNKGIHPSDETKRKISESCVGRLVWNKGISLSNETKRKISESLQGNIPWNKGIPMIGIPCTDEKKKKISKSLQGHEVSTETKLKLSEANSGENHPQWKGGISFEPYCPKFNEAFKESIREKFNRTCFLCPTTEAENGRKLSVHHINYNKDCLCDDSDCEFVPLCAKCHSKTNHNRTYWENLIMDKLAVITEVPASA